MFGFIKNLFKKETVEESLAKDTFVWATKRVESVVNAYFSSLDYVKYNIRPLNVNHFCKELRMNDEDVAKVHKLIKERLVRIKLEQIEGDFND